MDLIAILGYVLRKRKTRVFPYIIWVCELFSTTLLVFLTTATWACIISTYFVYSFWLCFFCFKSSDNTYQVSIDTEDWSCGNFLRRKTTPVLSFLSLHSTLFWVSALAMLFGNFSSIFKIFYVYVLDSRLTLCLLLHWRFQQQWLEQVACPNFSLFSF